MASSSAVLLSPKDREPLKCVNDANFAVICAFLEKFSGLCAIEHPNFLDLQKMLEGDEGEFCCTTTTLHTAAHKCIVAPAAAR